MRQYWNKLEYKFFKRTTCIEAKIGKPIQSLSIAVVIVVFLMLCNGSLGTKTVFAETMDGTQAEPRNEVGVTDYQSIVGRWVRQDYPYVIDIEKTDALGALTAHYYNPKRINVESARVKNDAGILIVEVVLRDKSYKGSRYTLNYKPMLKLLEGQYYHARSGQSLAVSFRREENK